MAGNLYGIQPQVIAGEAPWQNGKHSRHLETLKENLILLALERPPETPAAELLALSLGAKNEMHQIRGYSPNQWAFGQAKGRTESVLQQGENHVLQSRRDSEVFEEQLQVVLQARQTFLKADARRRLARAALARSRKVTNFETGNLVYYWRRGRGIPEGLWHGPARVVCVEKTGESQEGQLLGSIIWVVHGIVLYRCAPEQLRHVTHDLSGVDASLHENMTPSQILQRVETSMNYRDITPDVEALPADDVIHAEEPGPNLSREPEAVSRRLTSKQPPLAQRHVAARGPKEGGHQSRASEGSAELRQEGAGDSLHGPRRARTDGPSGREIQGVDLREGAGGAGVVHPVAPRPPVPECEVRPPSGVCSEEAGGAHRQEDEHSRPRQQEFEEHTRQRRERRREVVSGSGSLAYPSREGRAPEQVGSGSDGADGLASASGARTSGACEEPAVPDRPPAREVAASGSDDVPGADRGVNPGSGARSRSRTPARGWILAADSSTPTADSERGLTCSEIEDPESCGNTSIPNLPKHSVKEYKTGCFS